MSIRTEVIDAMRRIMADHPDKVVFLDSSEDNNTVLLRCANPSIARMIADGLNEAGLASEQGRHLDDGCMVLVKVGGAR
jgi:hypothetical protein